MHLSIFKQNIVTCFESIAMILNLCFHKEKNPFYKMCIKTLQLKHSSYFSSPLSIHHNTMSCPSGAMWKFKVFSQKRNLRKQTLKPVIFLDPCIATENPMCLSHIHRPHAISHVQTVVLWVWGSSNLDFFSPKCQFWCISRQRNWSPVQCSIYHLHTCRRLSFCAGNF